MLFNLAGSGDIVGLYFPFGGQFMAQASVDSFMFLHASKNLVLTNIQVWDQFTLASMLYMEEVLTYLLY